MTSSLLFPIAAALFGQSLAESTNDPVARHFVPPSPAEARAALDGVLALREFLHLRQEQVSWWARFWGWVRGVFRAIGEFLDDLPVWLLWVVAIWIVLTSLAILGHFVYTIVILGGGKGGRRGGRPGADGRDDELLGIRDLTFDSVYRRARELTAQGRFGDAVRHWYVAAILWLDERGRIAFQASKTDYDYIRELARDPVRRSGFQTLTQGFERCVYGEAPPSAEGCREMAAILETWVTESGRIEKN